MTDPVEPSRPAPTPAPPATPTPAPRAPSIPAWPMALLTGILAAQLGLAWIQGRMLNRQHAQLLEMREDIQGLAEALEQATADPGVEEDSLAPARRPRHRIRPAGDLRRAAFRLRQEEKPEQDPAAKELEAVRQSQEKAVKDAKVAQRKLSVAAAAQRAERAEKVDNASKGFMWAVLGAAVILFGAYAARGFIRRQRG
ncbi:MAG: hypothetical protein U0P81_02825 [Holophagaceae bacterium]